jgi:hypothetical protein
MIVVLLIFLLSVTGTCAVLHVPGDYPSVQRALNAATEHDTVLVADGLYHENLTFPPLNLTLASHFIIDGDSIHIVNTILDGSQPSHPDTGSVLYMEGTQDSSTVVMGFTIQGGTGIFNSTWYPGFPLYFGGGCAIRHASPRIQFNRIHSNIAKMGGGIYLGTEANAVLTDNEIFLNQTYYLTSSVGGGICSDSCSPQIIGNHIHNNLSGQGGGMSLMNSGEVIISDNYIDHNCGVMVSGGIFGPGSFIVSGNVIADNTDLAPLGNSGFHFGSSNPPTYVTICNNQFLRNISPGGGALDVTSNSVASIFDNLFEDNSAAYGGSALNLQEGTYSVYDNQFINNFDSMNATIFIGLNSNIEMHDNLITGSSNATNWPTAIYAYINIPVEIHDNNIYGNAPPAIALSPSSPVQTINALNNWWGDASGPYHPTLNPGGLGDEVGNGVLFDPWLSLPVWAPPALPTYPLSLRLYPSRPNPFNASTAISYELRAASYVNLKVYDTAGRLVATLVDGWKPAGSHGATFNGEDFASGIYLARLEAGELSGSGATPTIRVQKLVLLK